MLKQVLTGHLPCTKEEAAGLAAIQDRIQQTRASTNLEIKVPQSDKNTLRRHLLQRKQDSSVLYSTIEHSQLTNKTNVVCWIIQSIHMLKFWLFQNEITNLLIDVGNSCFFHGNMYVLNSFQLLPEKVLTTTRVHPGWNLLQKNAPSLQWAVRTLLSTPSCPPSTGTTKVFSSWSRYLLLVLLHDERELLNYTEWDESRVANQ